MNIRFKYYLVEQVQMSEVEMYLFIIDQQLNYQYKIKYLCIKIACNMLLARTNSLIRIGYSDGRFKV